MDKQHNTFSKQTKLVVLLLVLVIVSLFGGTLGIYSQELPVLSDSRVGPKYYAFEISNSVSSQSVAPGNSVTYTFSVSNFNSGGTAELDLQTYATIYFPTSLAGTGSVLAQLYCDGQLLGSSDTGTLYCPDLTLPENVQTTDVYSLTLTWQNADLTYLGENKWQTFDPSNIRISMAGSQ